MSTPVILSPSLRLVPSHGTDAHTFHMHFHCSHSVSYSHHSIPQTVTCILKDVYYNLLRHIGSNASFDLISFRVDSHMMRWEGELMLIPTICTESELHLCLYFCNVSLCLLVDVLVRDNAEDDHPAHPQTRMAARGATQCSLMPRHSGS